MGKWDGGLFESAFQGGDAALDEGFDNVLRGQMKANPDWWPRAYAWVVSRPHGERAKTEDWRKEIEANPNIGFPNHPNIYGALTAQLAKDGVIKRTGIRTKMMLRRSHSRMTDVWERV